MSTSVLIVDDSSFIVEGLVSILKKHSYRPLAAFSGEQCLKILKTEIPDIIILDILMEPMDGWETLTRIRQDNRARHVPVLIFSAKKLSVEDAETYRISIDDFIAKPIVPATLLTAIDRVVRRCEADRRLAASWRAAGVAEDRIDSYLTVKNKLTIDSQLHAVLQRQVEICTGDNESCLDIRKAMRAIEDRIQVERVQLNQISSGLPRTDETGKCRDLDHSSDAITAVQPRSDDKPAEPGTPDAHLVTVRPAPGNGITESPAVTIVGDTAAVRPDAGGPATQLQPITSDRKPEAVADRSGVNRTAGIPVDTGGLEPIYYNIETEPLLPVGPPNPVQKEDLFETDGSHHSLVAYDHDRTNALPVTIPAGESRSDHMPGEGGSFHVQGVAGDGQDRQEVILPRRHGGFLSRLIDSLLSLLRGLKLKR